MHYKYILLLLVCGLAAVNAQSATVSDAIRRDILAVVPARHSGLLTREGTTFDLDIFSVDLSLEALAKTLTQSLNTSYRVAYAPKQQQLHIFHRPSSQVYVFSKLRIGNVSITMGSLAAVAKSMVNVARPKYLLGLQLIETPVDLQLQWQATCVHLIAASTLGTVQNNQITATNYLRGAGWQETSAAADQQATAEPTVYMQRQDGAVYLQFKADPAIQPTQTQVMFQQTTSAKEGKCNA